MASAEYEAIKAAEEREKRERAIAEIHEAQVRIEGKLDMLIGLFGSIGAPVSPPLEVAAEPVQEAVPEEPTPPAAKKSKK
jgi:hypothetical protein